MRFKNFLAVLCIALTLTVTSSAGIMGSPPVAPPDPEPTPTQSMTADPSDTPTTPDAPEASDLVTTIVTTLIPLMF